jgi:hypothetical protein
MSKNSSRVDDELWRRLCEAFSEMALLELLLLIPKYRGISVLTNSLDLDLEAGAAGFPHAQKRRRNPRREWAMACR